MATIGDVAKHAGVSTTLVSRYLNGVKGVGPASRERIETAIRELQYVPDESARMLVRHRGGASAAASGAEGSARGALPPAVAIVCEDMDAQLTASLYFGAKRTVLSEAECRDYRILLFVISEDELRSPDEEETAEYIRRTCKAVICAAKENSVCLEKVRALSLPMASVVSEYGARGLTRGSTELKNACSALEELGQRLVVGLCAAVKNGETAERNESLPFSFSVAENRSSEEHNPVGHSLQSHLL